jgi:hypothetical protein
MKSSTTGIILASLTFAARSSAKQATDHSMGGGTGGGGMFVATTVKAAWIKPLWD